MTEFNKGVYEAGMREAVRLHCDGDYEGALQGSMQAYGMAPENSFEKGRAARDTAARYDRLGNLDASERWALTAYHIHNGLLRAMDEPSREAYRERAVSGMYIGVNGLRRYISERLDGEDSSATVARRCMRQTWSDLNEAKRMATGINRHVDQYEINAARRVSIAESLVGRRRVGLLIGAKAVLLACMSESPRLTTSESELSARQRMRAKAKALAGGVAAIGVGMLATTWWFGTDSAALKLADRTL